MEGPLNSFWVPINQQHTKLALKYTHPTFPEHRILEYTGKSGFTPIPPSNPYATLQDPQLHSEEYQRQLQRFRFRGFTTQELDDLEAFAPAYSDPINVRAFDTAEAGHFPIHPMFQRDRWALGSNFSMSPFMLPGGQDGHWRVSNPKVWEILCPCLRLTSMFIGFNYTFEWFVSVLRGTWDRVPVEMLPDNAKHLLLYLCGPRSLDSGTYDTSDFQAEFNRLATEVDFDIGGGWVNELSGNTYTLQRRGLFVLAHTKRLYSKGRTRITLAHELLIPLLRNDLTVAERLLDIYRVAHILLHEIAHALVQRVLISKNAPIPAIEPYFTGHCIPELGFSLNESILGGMVLPLTSNSIPDQYTSNTLSCAAAFSVTFFNRSSLKYAGFAAEPLLLNPIPEDFDYEDTYPVPLFYFASMIHPDYWNYAHQYGPGATRMGPKIFGSRQYLNRPVSNAPLIQPQFLPDALMFETGLSAEMQVQIIFENGRREVAKRLMQQFHDKSHREAVVNYHGPTHPIEMDIDIAFLSDLPRSVDRTPDKVDQMLASIPTPYCPQYEGIRDYIRKNSGPRRLALDINPGIPIPEHVLLNHVRRYLISEGHAAPSPEEWRTFLRTCHDRQEMFRWQPEGLVYWIDPPTLPVVDFTKPYPAFFDFVKPTVERVAQGRSLSLYRNWTKKLYQDFYWEDITDVFNCLLSQNPFLRSISDRDRWDRDSLGAFITIEGSRDDGLWCWGPHAVVRKRYNNFDSMERARDWGSAPPKTWPAEEGHTYP